MPERLHRAGKSGTCQRSTWLGNPVSGSNVSLKKRGVPPAGIEEPFGNAKDGERLCSGSQAGVKRRQPFDLKPASAGVDGRPAGKTRTDHVVFKQERVCRVSFLQRVRPCVKCPHCDVSLSYHRNGKMVCHYCGYEEPRTPVCPECGSRHIGEFRAGTQQIETL